MSTKKEIKNVNKRINKVQSREKQIAARVETKKLSQASVLRKNQNSSKETEELRSWKLGVSSANGTAKNVIYEITCPGEGSRTRWASEYASDPTALAAPFEKIDANFGASTDGTMQVGQTAAILRRDGLVFWIIYDANPSEDPHQYNAKFENPGQAVAGEFTLGEENDIEYPLPIAYLQTNENYSPHGNIQFCGATGDGDDERAFVWVDQDDICNFALTTASGSGSFAQVGVTINVYLWDGVRANAFTSIVTTFTTNTTNTINFEATGPGYYAFTYIVDGFTGSGSGQPILTMSNMNVSGYHSVWCHRSLPGFSSMAGSIDDIRFKGLSMMYTNNASDLYADGQVTGYQTPKGKYWYDYVSNGYDSLADLNGAVTLQAKNGFFGFMKPSQTSDMDMMCTWLSNGVQFTRSFFKLNPDSPMMVIIATSSNTNTSCEALWTVKSSVEFQTTNVMLDVDTSRDSPEIYSAAMTSVRDIPQFHENPLHLKDVLKKIGGMLASGAKFVGKYGPGILKTARLGSEFI